MRIMQDIVTIAGVFPTADWRRRRRRRRRRMAKHTSRVPNRTLVRNSIGVRYVVPRERETIIPESHITRREEESATILPAQFVPLVVRTRERTAPPLSSRLCTAISRRASLHVSLDKKKYNIRVLLLICYTRD